MLTISKIRSANYHKNDGKKVKENSKEYHKEDSVNTYFLGSGSMDESLQLMTGRYESKTDIPENGLERLSKGYHPITNKKLFEVTENKKLKEKDIKKIFEYLEINWDGDKEKLKDALIKSKKDFEENAPIDAKEIKIKLSKEDKLNIKEKYLVKRQYDEKDIQKIFNYLEINWNGNYIYLNSAINKSKKLLDQNFVITDEKTKHKLTDKEKKTIRERYFKDPEKNLGTDACLSAPKDFTLLSIFDKQNKNIYDQIYKEAIINTSKKIEETLINSKRIDKQDMKDVYNHFSRIWDGKQETIPNAIKQSFENVFNGIPVDETKNPIKLDTEIKEKIRGSKLARKQISVKPVMLAYDHNTSRPVDGERPDPQLHTHILIMKKALDDNGKWIAVDTKLLTDEQKKIGAFFRKELANGLREKLGFTTEFSKEFLENEDSKKGEYVNSFSVVGITKEQREMFSRRANKINHLAGDNSSYKIKKLISLSTRERKQEWDSFELFKEWQKDAEKVGLTQNYIESIKMNVDEVNMTKFIKRNYINPEKFYIIQATKKGAVNMSHLEAKLYEQEQYTGIKADKLLKVIKSKNLVDYDGKTRQWKPNFNREDIYKESKNIDKYFFNNLNNVNGVIYKINIEKTKGDKENITLIADIFNHDITKHEKTFNVKLPDHTSLDSMKMELGLLQNKLTDPDVSEEEKAKINLMIQQLGEQIKEEEKRLKNQNNQDNTI